MISQNLDKNNLHHAYLIEGGREEVVAEILEFIKNLKIETVGNADVSHISLDSFKIEDARNLKSLAVEKSLSFSKRIFIISANSFLLEAQNSLLKMFEEPIKNTHFFVVVPDTGFLLETFISRFYFVKENSEIEVENVEKFIKMPLQKRIDFIKELLAEHEEEDEEGNEITVLDSARSKALKFLNALEIILHGKVVKNFSGLTLPGVPGGTLTVQNSLQLCLDHLFKVREFIRMPGSSTKTLMESVALVIPNL